MGKTKIEWATDTWNAIRGCSRVSEGCRNCYAESVAYRFSGEGQPYEGLAVLKNGHASWTGKVDFVEKHLLDPIRWKGSKRIFVNSMSDLFHENVTDEMRDKIFAVMALADDHQFQILTKRPERMKAYLDMVSDEKDMQRWQQAADDLVPNCAVVESRAWPLPNVWLGVSTEDQKTADQRIPILLQTPAAIRFISAEPLLGPINLRQIPNAFDLAEGQRWLNVLEGYAWVTQGAYYDVCNTGKKLDWVITGGESGPGARPMISSWAGDIQRHCEAAKVAFFHKQNGEWVDAGHEEFGRLPSGKIMHIDSQGMILKYPLPTDEDADVVTMKRVGRTRAGETLYGKIYHAYPGEK